MGLIARVECPRAIFISSEGGQGDSWGLDSDFTKTRDEGVPINAGHTDITDNHVERLFRRQVEGVLCRKSNPHNRSILFQDSLHDRERVGFIIKSKDFNSLNVCSDVSISYGKTL